MAVTIMIFKSQILSKGLQFNEKSLLEARKEFQDYFVTKIIDCFIEKSTLISSNPKY